MRKNELTETLAGLLELIPLAESEYGRSHTIPSTMRQFLSRFGGNAGKNALTAKIREARGTSLERAGGDEDSTPRRLQKFKSAREANPNRRNVFGKLGQPLQVKDTESDEENPDDTAGDEIATATGEDANKKKEQGQSLAQPHQPSSATEETSRQLSTNHPAKLTDQEKQVPQNQTLPDAVVEAAKSESEATATDSAKKESETANDVLTDEKAEAFVTKVKTRAKKAADSLPISEDEMTQLKGMKPTAIASQFGAVRITLTLKNLGVEVVDSWSEVQLAAALKKFVK